MTSTSTKRPDDQYRAAVERVNNATDREIAEAGIKPGPSNPSPTVEAAGDHPDWHGDGYCGCTERCRDRDNCQYDVKPGARDFNDQDEVLLAYGILWCADTTDKRVHAARHELLKCLNKDLQAKAISAAKTILALVRDIRQMKGATFAHDFDAALSAPAAVGEVCAPNSATHMRRPEYLTAWLYTGQRKDQWPKWFAAKFDAVKPDSKINHYATATDGEFWRWFDREKFSELFVEIVPTHPPAVGAEIEKITERCPEIARELDDRLDKHGSGHIIRLSGIERDILRNGLRLLALLSRRG